MTFFWPGIPNIFLEFVPTRAGSKAVLELEFRPLRFMGFNCCTKLFFIWTSLEYEPFILELF